MKRAFVAIILASLALPCAASAVAADDVRHADFAQRLAVSEGTVKRVDAKAMTFVLTTGGKDITVTVTKDTKYKVDGKDARMEDALKPGAKVNVTHSDAKASLVEVVREKK